MFLLVGSSFIPGYNILHKQGERLFGVQGPSGLLDIFLNMIFFLVLPLAIAESVYKTAPAETKNQMYTFGIVIGIFTAIIIQYILPKKFRPGTLLKKASDKVNEKINTNNK